MSILIFVCVIVVLIVVHEFGHFLVAKWSGMRVDEFGLGYPPRAMTIATIGETAYTLNWLPFGGFVKIYGEDGDGAGPRAFSKRPRVLQALVLLAGIGMNLIFAYILITGALVMGTPRALSDNELMSAREVELMVANVLPASPAASAGLLAGDSILSAKDSLGEWHVTDPKSFSAFVAAGKGNPIMLDVRRNGVDEQITVTPKEGLVDADPSRFALGVEVVPVGIVPLSILSAIIEGAKLTWGLISLTAVGLAHFFYSILTLSANFSQVSGPVGIAGAVGSASAQGFGTLLSIMAIISINLALINLLPVPALDGGRLLLVIIESIIRRPIKTSVANSINAVGFVFLILLMVVVTAHDIFRILG